MREVTAGHAVAALFTMLARALSDRIPRPLWPTVTDRPPGGNGLPIPASGFPRRVDAGRSAEKGGPSPSCTALYQPEHSNQESGVFYDPLEVRIEAEYPVRVISWFVRREMAIPRLT
ncbi:hypothetical protein [Streptomyces megasporus]|uniref:hypothetical protein n=1 Tax=Streptomyces megasporus TaxID=44060 RepID=UPI0012FF16D3|nr:hypothetical protein [Streptomyces megasporus]